MPPTKRTSPMSDLETSASWIAFLQGSTVFRMSPSTRVSNLERLNFKFMCFGPDASMVRYGRLMSVWREDDSSHFAFSAASLSRCMAIGSLVISSPCCKPNKELATKIRYTLCKKKKIYYKSKLYLFLEFRHKEIDKCIIEIFSTEESVTIGRLHFKYSLLDFQDGNIESTSTKVINSNSKKDKKPYK